MHRSTSHQVAVRAAIVAVFALSVLTAGTAHAYPWMIRHEYTGCAQCHVDPSGSGPLTAYGRAMGEVIMRTQYGRHRVDEPEEPGNSAKFLWGGIPLPEWLDFGGSLRWMSLTQKIGDTPLASRIIYMQQDLSATISAGRWLGSASIGFSPEGGLLAALTSGPMDNAVSREHWIGYRLDEASTFLLRAGRMNLPFGVRDILHTLNIRAATRTDTNDGQEHGVALSYSGERYRAEVMGILGNFQTHPDDYRERGYSAYFEWEPTTTAGVGVSSRIAHVALDPRALTPMWRHAHGLFARWATPYRPLVLLSEADYVVDSPKERPREQGAVTMAQADLELVQGVHYQMLGEAWDFGPHGSGFSESLWLSFLWFFASHADIRIDGVYESVWSGPGQPQQPVELLLAQAHVYL